MRLIAALALCALFLACGGTVGGSEDAVTADASSADAVGDAAPDSGPDDAGARDGGSPDATAADFPLRLSETGLYRDRASKTLAPGVRAYTVRHELWADGADKARYVLLPGPIDAADPDHWSFPIGTKLWKSFSLGGRLLETRLLEKRSTGWTRIAYVWDEGETDARAAPEGQVAARGTAHEVPAAETCDRCHLGSRDGALGVSAVQLHPDALAAWIAEGLFVSAPAPYGGPPGDPLSAATLGYLHATAGTATTRRTRWPTGAG